MIVRRGLIDKLKPFLDRVEYISIIGPRQSGKTTFLSILKESLPEGAAKDISRVAAQLWPIKQELFRPNPTIFLTI